MCTGQTHKYTAHASTFTHVEHDVSCLAPALHAKQKEVQVHMVDAMYACNATSMAHHFGLDITYALTTLAQVGPSSTSR